MRRSGLSALVAVAALGLGLGAGAALADEDAELVIDGEAMVTKVAPPEGHPLDEILSGWRFRNDETQALETDDFDNPGFLFVEQGQALWDQVDGTENKSCSSCHNEVSSMAGVKAAMPKWSDTLHRPVTLEQQVNLCRTERMGAKEWKWESNEMLSMTALIGVQSRGMPVHVQTDGPMAEWFEKGQTIYYTRSGQLDMSCASCHEQNYGNMIRADHLSQGQSNGFPTYRLKWQNLGSLHRRLKGCMNDVRAQAYDVGSDEFVALELYLAYRGQGLSVETPAVRN